MVGAWVEFPLALLAEAHAHDGRSRRRMGEREDRPGGSNRYLRRLSNSLFFSPLFPPLESYLGPLNASIDGNCPSRLTRNGLLGIQDTLPAMWQPSGGQCRARLVPFHQNTPDAQPNITLRWRWCGSGALETIFSSFELGRIDGFHVRVKKGTAPNT